MYTIKTINIDSKKRWISAFSTGSVLTGEANKMAGIGNLLKALKTLLHLTFGSGFSPWKCTDNAFSKLYI